MKIRPVNLETDLPVIAANYSAFERSKAILPEEVRAWVDASSPGRIAQLLVVVDADESIEGSVEVSHENWHKTGTFIVLILVGPHFRRQGIGSALWDASVDFLQDHPITRLISLVQDDDPASLAFAKSRGFTVERHRFASQLDLGTFDEGPYLAEAARLEQDGLRFCTLADFPENEETARRFYELSLAITRDLPGQEWDLVEYPEFFRKYELGSPWFRREGQLLALAGDEWVGFASVQVDPATCRDYNANTGVIRSYRGRRIAQALKGLAVRYARRLGAVAIDTDNDSLNAPMLAINRKFGYQPQPGKYTLVCLHPTQM